MIPGIIAAIVGVLVPQAEKLISGQGQGPVKKAWVIDMVHELMSIITDHLPDWLKNFVIPSQAALEAVLSETIEAAVSKLKAKAA